MEKKETRINFKGSLVIGLISLIFCLGLVFAVQVVSFNSAVANNVTEDVTNTFNISINITESPANQNITQFNITLPANFTFLAGSNGNLSDGIIFRNTSNVLSWNSSSATQYLSNGTGTKNGTFWFNATCTIPGVYTFQIVTTNDTAGANLTYTNLSVTVNDTNAPTGIVFASPSATGNTNQTSNSSYFNFNVTDEGTLQFANVSIYNKTNGIISTSASLNFSPAGNKTFTYNFTGLADGNYSVNITVNDTYGNKNVTNRTLVIDTIAPVITHSCTPTSVNTAQTITCICSATDATSGVKTGPTYTLRPSTLTDGTGQTTTCTALDYAGNTATSTITYDVFTSNAAPGSGGSVVSKWVKQIKLSDSELNLGQTLKVLKKNYRLTFNVKGVGHQVGITSMTDKTVTIEVASTPQTATLNIGDLKKFDVDDDGYYDISVKLNSITGTDAGLVIASINEKVIVAPATEETTTGEKISEGIKDIASGKSSTMWIIIIVIVVLVLIGVGYKYKKK